VSEAAVVRLEPRPGISDAIREQAIETLTTALERAKNGEIACLVLVIETTEGAYEQAFTGSADVARRIGMLRLVEHRMLTMRDE
jgi:1,4-dihydroxy-2-naphthoyl-CoA synthase